MAHWPEVPGGIDACQGCQLVVNVDSTTTFPGEKYDLKEYWNLAPGHAWTLAGINHYAPEPVVFTSRVSIDEVSNLCGNLVYPWRVTKDKEEGYWGPKYHNGNASGLQNQRHLISYFQEGEKWSENMMGILYHKGYQFPTHLANPLAEGGTFSPDFGLQTKHYSDDGVHNFENTYYAPYVWSARYAYNGWSLKKVDRFYPTGELIPEGKNCRVGYQPSPGHYWDLQIYDEEVETPAYSGPAVRLRFFEAGLPIAPIGQPGRWITREDWYLARGIGLVQLDKWGLTGKCDTDLTTKDDPACWEPGPLEPPIQLKLRNYYIGEPLVVSLWPRAVSQTGSYQLRARSQSSGQPYTGKLEVKVCISDQVCTPTNQFVWPDVHGQANWVQDGGIEVDLSGGYTVQPGLRQMVFRPVIERLDQPDITGEVSVTRTELPWSNEVSLRITQGEPVANDQWRWGSRF